MSIRCPIVAALAAAVAVPACHAEAPTSSAVPADDAGGPIEAVASRTSPTVDAAVVDATVSADAATSPEHERIRRAIADRFRSHDAPDSARLADELFERDGVVTDLAPATRMKLGWRGVVQFVPELPVGKYARHLAWIHDAFADEDDLFARLDPTGAHAVLFRHRDLQLFFTRSVGRHTPSAYAMPGTWGLTYNVEGSLNVSADAVRETVLHELVHANDDADAGAPAWSETALEAPYQAILAKCGRRMPCLAPYAPTETKVRGGTYYAFQPADYDPVREYAAEIAVRWYREERAIVRGEKVDRPFKCGPPENAAAWQLVVSHFFGGLDSVPGC